MKSFLARWATIERGNAKHPDLKYINWLLWGGDAGAKWLNIPLTNKMGRLKKDITKTNAFKKWFGKSKVVDENGDPLVVYHGTGADFNVFKIGSTGGIFFSNNIESARRFSEGDLKREGNNPRIIEAYLKIEKPFDKNTIDDKVVDAYYEEYFSERPFINKKSRKNILSNKYERFFSHELVTFGIVNKEPLMFVLKNGYDGIIIDSNKNSKSFIAFTPTQIKSATGNNGNFDPENPSILNGDFTQPDLLNTSIDYGDEPEPSPAPMAMTKPIPTKKPTGVLSSSDIMNSNYDVIELKGQWTDFMEHPERNLQLAIYGKPKNGKTVFSMQLANQLARHGTVLYNLADQGFSLSTQKILKITGLNKNPNVYFSDGRTLADLEAKIQEGKYDFVFIDLINKYKLTPDEFDAFRKKHRDIGFILVFESTKDGNFKGDQAWTHDVHAVIEVVDFVAYNTGRYGAGEFNVWPERVSELEK